MTEVTPYPRPTETPGDGTAAPSEERIAVGLADLAAAAEALRRLDLEDIEPGLSFDAAWEPEAER